MSAGSESPLLKTRPVPAEAADWEFNAYPDEESMSVAVANRLIEELRAKPNALIGLATGDSPKRAYELMVARARTEPSLFAQARWIKLDEWGGLTMDDPASCESFLRRHVLAPLAVPCDRYFGWESQPDDPDVECRRMAAVLAANGPIDVQVLGLGANGHLGFNEPADRLQGGPHIAQLSRASLSHSMLNLSRGRVSYGLTIGMDDILQARRILLIVSGERKARQFHRLVTGNASPDFPASFLRHRPSVSSYCDAAAAKLLPPDMPGFRAKN